MAYGSKRKMGKAKLGGKTVRFKKGSLRKQLKLKPNQKLTRAGMRRASKKKVGSMVRVAGKSVRLTKLMKKRLNLGANLMKRIRSTKTNAK